MKKMFLGSKKNIAIVVAIVMIVLVSSFMVVGCVNKSEEIKIVAPDGATALAVTKLLEGEIDQAKINVEILAPANISTGALSADFAVVPANLAANLYNKGKDIKIIDIVTHGNLYMLGSREGTVSLGDLVGKVVHCIGQGNIPDLIFQYALTANGYQLNFGDSPQPEKVTITYSKEGGEVMTKLIQAKNKGLEAYGVLAEPAASTGISKGLFEKMDLQTMWQNQTESQIKGYPQAVLIAVGDNNKNTKLIKAIRNVMRDNNSWLADNATKAVENIKNIYPQSNLPASLSSETIQRCNINSLNISDNKDYFNKLMQSLMTINNGASIGEKMPDDGLFYSK